MTLPMLRRDWHQIFWVAFALMLTALIIHAVIYPLNGATPDSWTYYYYGHVGETLFYRTDRDYVLLFTNLLEWILPNNAPSRTFFQPFVLGFNATLLYLIITGFLPKKTRLAYLVAFFYLIYYPHNPDLARTLFSAGVYFWMQFLVIVSIFCFYEALQVQNKYLAIVLMLCAALCSFMSIRGYEGSILSILSTPFWLIFLPKLWTRKTLFISSIWFLIVARAMWHFFTVTLPLASSTYVGGYLREQFPSINTLFNNIVLFYQLSFPTDKIFTLESNFIVPAVFIAGILLCAFWLVMTKITDTDNWKQSYLPVVVLGIIGIYYVMMGAAAWVYTGFTVQNHFYRMFFFTHIGLSLLLGGLAMLVSYALSVILSTRLVIPISGLIAFFGFMGAHWYYQAQVYASNVSAETRYFHESLEMFRDVTAIVPTVEENTLLILFCERYPDYAPLLWSPPTVYAGNILYDNLRLAHQVEVEFRETDVVTTNDHRGDSLTFEYDQIIGLECMENRWRIMPYMPSDIAESFPLAVELYNPYLRIHSSLLPIERTRLLSWGTVRIEGYEPDWGLSE